MSIRTLLRVFAVGAALVATGAAAAKAPAHDLAGKTVVLVHGAFADGSSWAKVIPLLSARGLQVIAVQNPLSSRGVDQASGPVVLVGHSWGGVVTTEAGADPKVKALVYAAAFAPDVGQSIASMTEGLPPPPCAPYLCKDEGGYLTLSEEGVRKDFAQDLPPAKAQLIAVTQGPGPQAPSTPPPSGRRGTRSRPGASSRRTTA